MNIAYGKIILMGEHSVVYGHPAIVIPFKAAKCETTFTKGDCLLIRSSIYEGVLTKEVRELNGLYEMIKQVGVDYQIEVLGEIDIKSNLLIKSGMGSSAASTYSILSAIDNEYQLKMTNDEFIKYVNIAESYYHFKSSGIDTAAAVLKKPLIFSGGKYEVLDLTLSGYLLLVDTGIRSNTKDAVSLVEREGKKDVILKLGNNTNTFIKYMNEGNDNKIYETINNSQKHLNKLNVSHKIIDDIVRMANSKGLAAKLTGGGLGGLVIVYHKDYKRLEEFQKTLPYNSYEIIDLGDLNEED